MLAPKALDTTLNNPTTIARAFLLQENRGVMARLQAAVVAIALFGLLAIATAGEDVII